MTTRYLLLGVILFTSSFLYAQTIVEKPRIIVTTDGEIDDKSSFVRFLLYTNDMDVSGIIATNSVWQKNGHGVEWIHDAISLYAELHPNLKMHDPNYPAPEHLRSKVVLGNENPKYLEGSPPYADTKGSELILKKLLDSDIRPVHVNCWGGANTVAQALWKLKQNYSQEEYQKAVNKIRIYCVSFQDKGGHWIKNNVKEAMIIEAGSWCQTWNYHPQKENPYPEYMSEEWLNTNIKSNHGPLGAWYPQKNVSEGDTPAFLPLVNNGLLSHLDYSFGGWGGRFLKSSDNYWTDAIEDGDSKEAITRWIPAVQNDFAARMDWTFRSVAESNHPPIIKVDSEFERNISTGELLTFDASASFDPDEDELVYKWWQYKCTQENQDIIITDSHTPKVTIAIPNKLSDSIHIILEVSD